MRDPKRLPDIYVAICLLHQKFLPDIRFGQAMYNFSEWLRNVRKLDWYYIEDDRIISLFEKHLIEVYGVKNEKLQQR